MMRGPNWLTAMENTSSVTEKIRASTVLTGPRIAPRIARASSMLPTESQVGKAIRLELANASSVSVAANKMRMADAIANGIGSRLVPGITRPARTKRLAPIRASRPSTAPPLLRTGLLCIIGTGLLGFAGWFLRGPCETRPPLRRAASNNPNDRHRRLLRVHREWPGCRAADRDDKFSSPHVALKPRTTPYHILD